MFEFIKKMLKNNEKIKPSEERREEARKWLFENLKDTEVNMKTIEEDAKNNPDKMIFQGVKNPEEYRCRFYVINFIVSGELEKAIEYCNKGIEINPKSAYLLQIRGRLRGNIRQFKDGIEDLNEALKIKPNYSDAFSERGYIKQKIGDIIGAEEDYKKAIEIEPSLSSQILELKKEARND